MALSGVLDNDGQFGFTDARLGAAATSGGSTTAYLTEDNNYGNTFDLDTRLQAIDGTTYTQAFLRTMTKNDKVYALRIKTADAAGIK